MLCLNVKLYSNSNALQSNLIRSSGLSCYSHLLVFNCSHLRSISPLILSVSVTERNDGNGADEPSTSNSSVRPIVGRKDFGTAAGSAAAGEATTAVSRLNLNAEATPFQPRNSPTTTTTSTAQVAVSPQLMELARRLTLLKNDPSADAESIGQQTADQVGRLYFQN